MRCVAPCLLLVLLAGCGSPSYKLVVAPKPEPWVSRSVFVPALVEKLPERVLVLHPRWTEDKLDEQRAAIERGFLARGVQVRFVDPRTGPLVFGQEVAQQAAQAGAAAVLEVTELTVPQESVPRYLVWNAKERVFQDAEQAAFFAAPPLQRYRLSHGVYTLTARLIEAATGETLASYRLSLPWANYPYPGVYTATLVAAAESDALVPTHENSGEVFSDAMAQAARELLLETLGRELPKKPTPPAPPPPVPPAEPEKPAKTDPAR